MSKQAFKIIGVLLFAALLVSLAVGGVAAAEGESLTGNVIWSIDLAELYNNGVELLPDGSPVVHNGKVYVPVWNPSQDRTNHGVYCFDADDGSFIWKSTGYTSRSGLTAYGDYLYVGYMSTVWVYDEVWDAYYEEGFGGVKCLDLETGEVVGDTGNIVKLSKTTVGGSTATPIVVDESKVWIYSYADCTNGESALYSYDLTLSPSSKQEVLLGGNHGAMYTSATASEDGKLIYTVGKEGVVAINTSTSTYSEEWYFKPELNGFKSDTLIGTPVYSDDSVYVMVAIPTADYSSAGFVYYKGELISINATTGKKNWNVTHGVGSSTVFGSEPTTPVVNATHVFATGVTGLIAYEKENGDFAWKHDGGTVKRASPTLAGNTIYYGTYSAGTLYAVSTETGTELWKFKPEIQSQYLTMVEGRPAVADDKVYVGFEAVNTFYAFSVTGVETSSDGAQFIFNNVVNLGTQRGGLSAIAAAADLGNFAYDIVTLEEGTHVDNFNEITSTASNKWVMYVNGVYSSTPISQITLNDGDTITFYYCAWNGEGTPDKGTATHILNIKVNFENPAGISSKATHIYDDPVTLGLDEVPITLEDGSTQSVAGNSAMAAIVAAGIPYDVYVPSWGGLYVDGLNDVMDDYYGSGYSWALYYNGMPATTGIADVTLNDGDSLTLYYCKQDANYNYLIDEATHIVNIIAKTTYDYTLTLRGGWNFISVPQYLSENMDTGAELFANVDTGNFNVLGFDGENQRWTTVTKTTNIQPLAAYWIYSVENGATIDLTYTNDLSRPASMKVYDGWNAVGVSADGAILTTKYLAPVENWRTIHLWNKETGKFDAITESDDARTMTLGTGNWLFVGDGDSVVGLTT